MTLSKPEIRNHIHTRDIKCYGYKRKDGLWDIEGSIIDTKTYSFDNTDRNGISSGEPIHHMQVRITLDDDLMVKSAEASTISSPYSICPSITPNFKKLKGIKIGPGWRKQIKKMFGGVKGCTHIRDLLAGPLAVTAYQTIIPYKQKKQFSPPPEEIPSLLNTCVAFSEDSQVVRSRWPQFSSKKVDD